MSYDLVPNPTLFKTELLPAHQLRPELDLQGSFFALLELLQEDPWSDDYTYPAKDQLAPDCRIALFDTGALFEYQVLEPLKLLRPIHFHLPD